MILRPQVWVQRSSAAWLTGLDGTEAASSPDMVMVSSAFQG